MYPPPVRSRFLLSVVALGVALLLGTPAFAAPAASSANANPASQNLLSKLPDPSTFKQNPLENAVRDKAPFVNDPAYKDLQVAAKRKDLKTCLKDLRDLTSRYPDKYPALFGLRGLVELQLRLFGEAENSFHRTIKLDSKNLLGWYGLSLAEAIQGHAAGAAAAARTSVQISDSFAPGWLMLAVCQVGLKQTGSAVVSATHATRVASNNSHAWVILAICKVRDGKPAAATGDLEHARSLNPNDVQASELLGSCYVQLNQPARAVGPYQQALKVAPKNPALYRELGYCYLAAGKPAAAEQTCLQGIKLQPNYGPTWDMLGLCYRREGKQKEAVDAFEHAVKASPRDLNARTHLDEARLGVAAPRA